MTIEELLNLLNPKSITELYCDLITSDKQTNFLNRFNIDSRSNTIFYIGLNPDAEIISHNRQLFRLDKAKFFSPLNAVQDAIPCSDLLILNNFFSSLSVQEIWLLLGNVKESHAGYLMVEKETAQETSDTRLNHAPFYFPKSEMSVSIQELNKSFDIYSLEKIAFLLDYLEDGDSLLRSQAFPFLQADFNFLRNTLGDVFFKQFLRSYKMGWETSVQFISREEIRDLFKQHDNLCFYLRDHYYRVLFRREFDTVTAVWPFFNEANHFKFYLILLNYLNFLLLDETYNLFYGLGGRE